MDRNKDNHVLYIYNLSPQCRALVLGLGISIRDAYVTLSSVESGEFIYKGHEKVRCPGRAKEEQ